MKKIQFLFLMFLTSFLCYADDFNHHIGVSLKSSTNGIGADVYYSPLEKLAVKAGFELFTLNATSETVTNLIGDNADISVPMPSGDDLNFGMSAKFKTGSLSFQVGYQPLSFLYITGGLGSFLLDATVSGTPSNDLKFATMTVDGQSVTPKISKDKLGDFSLTLTPSYKVAPYFGFGLGSFVPRKQNRVSFAVEIGTYIMGSPKLGFNLPVGLKASNVDYGDLTQAQINQYYPNANSEIDTMIADMNSQLQTSIDDVNSDIKGFVFYPVVKLTIGIRAYDFKK